MSVEVRVDRRGGVAVVGLTGELDIAGSTRVEAALREAETGSDSVLVDLRGLRFLDSTGLRLILAADARARAAGRGLQIVRGPDPVHRVFQLALLEDRLQFIHAPEEA